jgi:hypothetical protein
VEGDKGVKLAKSLRYAPSKEALGIYRLSGERRLLIEILKRAINDYVGHWYTDSNANEEFKIEAGNWIFKAKDDDFKAPWSFEWLCEHLGVDAESVKANARKLEAEATKNAKKKRLSSLECVELDFINKVYD